MRRPTADLGARLVQVVAGASVSGIGLAWMIRAKLGAQPWDVLHLALASLAHVTVGTVIVAMSMLVLLAWWPLRLRPGWGTLAMTFIPGLACDGALWITPTFDNNLPMRVALLVCGIGVFAVGTAAVIRAGLGPGARDGLMVGACRRFGWSVFAVRTGIEVTVLALGLALAGFWPAVHAGTAGVGTVVIALSLGPLLGRMLPKRAIDSRRETG
jgi:uncharacterized membrane protein YczE